MQFIRYGIHGNISFTETIDPNGMWIDNNDGTFTAEKGDTLWGLFGKDWRESQDLKETQLNYNLVI
ncbi:MAG: hypothetical protein FWC36_02710 [Spirochaetes bacterium]|nr:hypothetical protein [Spirochaetota bacterium]